ncbi:uncharacterized protein LOC116341141 [Contarinia nasturtii]|uniref:uncharacterized protein LOC116341141 n=1 Tax=Contarinia nasturtii TaxID=265458 RepID=UPI0012D485E5|nr:uncharacterized protein LOC116341141 [Contarinia nasturtii]
MKNSIDYSSCHLRYFPGRVAAKRALERYDVFVNFPESSELNSIKEIYKTESSIQNSSSNEHVFDQNMQQESNGSFVTQLPHYSEQSNGPFHLEATEKPESKEPINPQEQAEHSQKSIAPDTNSENFNESTILIEAVVPKDLPDPPHSQMEIAIVPSDQIAETA